MGLNLSVDEREEIYTIPLKIECKCEIDYNGDQIWECYQTCDKPETITESYGIPGFYRKTIKTKHIREETLYVGRYTKDEMEKYVKGHRERIIRTYGDCCVKK